MEPDVCALCDRLVSLLRPHFPEDDLSAAVREYHADGHPSQRLVDIPRDDPRFVVVEREVRQAGYDGLDEMAVLKATP